jgi:hypothetical protein
LQNELQKAEDEINSVNQQEEEGDNAGSLEDQRRKIREDVKSKKDRLREAKVRILLPHLHYINTYID